MIFQPFIFPNSITYMNNAYFVKYLVYQTICVINCLIFFRFISFSKMEKEIVQKMFVIELKPDVICNE